ncbi:hypothetical protein [Rhodococcus sp. NPDC058521]|uniref:hypothetical protein n=1 Tax=Rhodococcus sp. NPDC058521 TaxID=3346536 RepID=UPI00365C343F
MEEDDDPRGCVRELGGEGVGIDGDRYSVSAHRYVRGQRGSLLLQYVADEALKHPYHHRAPHGPGRGSVVVRRQVECGARDVSAGPRSPVIAEYTMSVIVS